MTNWNASAFFERLTAANKFAAENGFSFHSVSGLEGFHGSLSNYQKTRGFVCVSDTSDGTMEIEDNTPHTSRVKTVFLALRHKAEDDDRRNAAFDTMRELFRQFMSVLVQEKVRVEDLGIYLDSRIAFKEIDRYFFSGAACAFFQIKIDTFTDISYNPDEWTEQQLTQ